MRSVLLRRSGESVSVEVLDSSPVLTSETAWCGYCCCERKSSTDPPLPRSGTDLIATVSQVCECPFKLLNPTAPCRSTHGFAGSLQTPIHLQLLHPRRLLVLPLCRFHHHLKRGWLALRLCRRRSRRQCRRQSPPTCLSPPFLVKPQFAGWCLE